MKKSEGFTKLMPILFVFLFYLLALGCLVLVLRRMDTSVAYAIWASAGIFFIGYFIYKLNWFWEINRSIILILSKRNKYDYDEGD